MAFTKHEIKDIYRKRAGSYDLSANLYYLIGFRENHFRKQAIAELSLQPGSTVVEIGCGTGLNFQYLRQEIGDDGKIVGVDLTDAMLEQARQRIRNNDWRNVEIVQSDAAEYHFEQNIQGVISTFALTLVPEYEKVIEHAAQALAPGGRMVVLDLKLPEKWPLWLTRLGMLITRPFGVTLDLSERKPWETMHKYFTHVTTSELYGGFAYITVGQK